MTSTPLTNNDNTNRIVSINETTPLVSSGTFTSTKNIDNSSLHSAVSFNPSIRYGDGNDSKLLDDSFSLLQQQRSINRGDSSSVIHNSIRSVQRTLVRASSKLGEFINQHTGSIGMLGSISIMVNSLTGPAMLNLPATFSRSGLIPTIACLLFVMILSALCSLHMANVISKVPGNGNFKQEVEYSQAYAHFWGSKWFAFTQILFFFSVTCLNISSIVDMSQVTDTFLGHWWPNGGSAAIQILYATSSSNFDTTDIDSSIANGNATGSNNDNYSYGISYNLIRWDYSGCTEKELMDGICTPFREFDGIIITAGKIITTSITLPVAFMDLKENAQLQAYGFLLLLATCAQFIIQFATSPTTTLNNISLWGEDWGDLFGVVLFNFAAVIAVPAWLYEREPHVDVPTVIHASNIMSIVFYIAVGLLGCMAMPNVADNMLQTMMSGSLGVMMQISASVFAFGIIGLGIPLFSVLTRLNLTSSGLCSIRTGNLLAIGFPFTVSLFISDGESITTMLSWGGVIFTSLIAFILPLMLALHVATDFDYEGTIAVYNDYINNQRSEIISLRVLLVLTVGAVLSGLIGNFYSLGN